MVKCSCSPRIYDTLIIFVHNNKNNTNLPTFLYVFPWQFSVSTQCALPTRSQFPSLHRNHSGHTFLLLLILRPWEWSTRAKKWYWCASYIIWRQLIYCWVWRLYFFIWNLSPLWPVVCQVRLWDIDLSLLTLSVCCIVMCSVQLDWLVSTAGGLSAQSNCYEECSTRHQRALVSYFTQGYYSHLVPVIFPKHY